MSHIPNCYIYTIRDNQLIIKKGDVFVNERYRSASFRPADNNTHTACAIEAWDIRYGKLWLPNRDDERAKELLIKYHESRIEALRKQIKSHELTIRNLKGTVEGGD